MRSLTAYPGRDRAIFPRLIALAAAAAFAAPAGADVDIAPVTDAELENPPAADWLMFSRSYDNRRMSPLAEVTRDNVSALEIAWSREMHPGTQENIPIVRDGVMFVANPGAIVQAIDGASGELLWEYRRELPADLGDYIRAIGRARTLAIYGSRVYYAAPDGYLVALDAASGEPDWAARVHDYRSETQHTTGPLVVNGKVLTGRNCGNTRAWCFIAAHDAVTGEELWRFYTTAAPGEPGGDTWASLSPERRIASPWGLPGGFDAARNLVYWGVANPNPHTRIKRHDGKPFAVPLEAPSELYSNSTLALDPDSGELKWYYQHLPGDDWDSDYTHERILFRSPFDPDPEAVRWINPGIRRGEVRDMLVTVGEPGGLWVLDRDSGDLLWATPFPFDTPDFHIAGIDVETGRTRISRDKILTREGETHTTCFQNTKSYWPMAFDAGRNALYVPYHDACVTRTGKLSVANGHTRRTHLREGGDPDAFAGLARVDMASGRITRLHTQRNPGNGAILLTAGGLVFWGDMSGTFYALDADSGEILWDASVEGIIQTSTITYAAEGRQYVAVLTGDGLSGTFGPLAVVSELEAEHGRNAIHVFALPVESIQ